MPWHLPVKHGERLRHVEVEPLVRRKGPEAEVESVGDDRYSQHSRATDDDFSDEHQQRTLSQRRCAVKSEAGECECHDGQPYKDVGGTEQHCDGSQNQRGA